MVARPLAKKRRFSPPDPLAAQNGFPSSNYHVLSNLHPDSAEGPVDWDDEQTYEQLPRKSQKDDRKNLRLPIKTAEGQVQQLEVPELSEEEEEKEEDLVSEDDSFASLDGDALPDNDFEKKEQGQAPQVSPWQEILNAKEELASAAGLINESPEENIGALRTLADISASTNSTVTKLALVTQLSVYKDIIPGYRIRPLSQEDLGPKISKEVRKLRGFEQGMVMGYQNYVHNLVRLSSASKSKSGEASEEARSLASVAISCASNLLTSVPHFNFRSDLLKMIVQKLGRRNVNQDGQSCLSALQQLFAEDDEGNATLEAASLLAKTIKNKHYQVDAGVLRLFLHLRLLSSFTSKASASRVDKATDDQDPSQRHDYSHGKKKPKQKREFRTKGQKKLDKEHRAIANEFKEADAVVSHEERDKKQAETLKLVFGVYFRVLKERVPHLMQVVLEGLEKYAHLINQDFFGDLLESLKELIAETGASTTHDSVTEEPQSSEVNEEDGVQQHDNQTSAREILLCINTAFGLLQGQDVSASASSLGLDLTSFVRQLYRLLHPLAVDPDVDLSAKSLRLPDPHTRTRLKSFQPDTSLATLLVRALTSTLLPQNTAPNSLPPTRIAAFAKQMLTISLHMPSRVTGSFVSLLAQVVKTHKRRIGGLWNTEERKGDGLFDGASGDVEGCNVFAGTVWEGELLRCHFVPSVREKYVRGVEGALRDT